MTHGGRRSLDRAEALVAIAGKRQELIQHLGGDPSIIQSDLARDYARVAVLIETAAANIEVHGVLSVKGRTRAAVTMLLQLLERRQRWATMLELERRAKPVASVTEINVCAQGA
jgi:hypothetical protein